MPEGNIDQRVLASVDRRPGVVGHFALTMMYSKQPVTPYRSCLKRTSSPFEFEYAVQAEKARNANG